MDKIKFPQQISSLEDDPFRKLCFWISLWGQNDKYFFLYIGVVIYKSILILCRTIYLFQVKELNLFLDLTLTYLISLMSIIKLIYLLLYSKDIRLIFTEVKKLFLKYDVDDLKLEKSLKQRFEFINRLVFCHYMGCNVYALSHVIFVDTPIPEGRHRIMPTLITVPFDIDKSPNYEIVYFLIAFDTVFTITASAFYDLLFIYAAQHLCGQFQILGLLIKQLDFDLMIDQNDDKKFQSEIFQKSIQQKISFCVKHHNILLRFASRLYKFSSIIFGLQLLFTFLTLVVVGDRVTETFDGIMRSAMLVHLGAASLMQFVVFAIQSTDIQIQSNIIADAIYQCNWYLFDASNMRSLCIMLTNAQKEIIMSGAGLVNIDNEIIVEMLQKVFSCVTLLKSMSETV